MYLSRLEIFGFKSFAQKIELKFNGGITAIVGPNGCGKTNIVDAIRWVLGEQRASVLRSDKMEDVIFNGTRNRKPLGMAEVSITIENTKKILPTEYSEVTITRRVFRSGESEYFLNKVPCRLKDIIELFADTGMGANAYSVIELKMIETLLSEKAEERRKLFEEASGITKYKQRKKITLRKLEDVRNDLSRVNDIISEVQKNVASLERQAKKAEKYRQLFDELKRKEIELFEREYAELRRALIYLEERLNAEKDKKVCITDELSQKERLLELLRAEIRSIESQIEETHVKIESESRDLSLTEQEIALLRERKRLLIDGIEKMNNEKIELQRKVLELSQSLSKDKLIFESTYLERETLQGEYIEKKAELDALTKELDEKRLNVKNLNEMLIEKMNEISQKRSQIEKIKGKIENLNGKTDLLNEDRAFYEREIIESETELNFLLDKKAIFLNELASAERILSEKEQLKESIRLEIEDLKKKIFVIQGEISKRVSKIDFLKELIEKQVDLSEGAQFLIQNYNSNFKSVSNLFDVDTTFSLAIESALGESVGYLVVDTIEDAEKAIEILKLQNKNKVTFICLEKVPENYALNLPVQGDGVIGWANDLVLCDKKFKKVLDFLLDDYLVVQDKSSAIEALRKYGNIKCVTLEGEVYTNEGLIKGGSANGLPQSEIGRRKQIEILEKEISKLKKELDIIQNEFERKTEEFESINLREFAEVVKNIQASLADVEKMINQAEYKKIRSIQRVNEIIKERDEIESELKTLSQVLKSLEDEITILEGEKEQIEYNLSIATTEYESLERQWSEKSKDVSELNIKVISADNDVKNIENNIKRLEQETVKVSAKINEYESNIEQSKIRVEEIELKLIELNERRNTLENEILILRDKLKELQSRYNEKLVEIQTLEREVKEERVRYEERVNLMHDLEIRANEVRFKMQNIKQRAQEEYQIELEYKDFTDSNENLRQEVETLKGKIKLLGPVNLLAFDDYQEEKRRLEFLISQRDDLLESEKTLKDTINEINQTAERKFLETFDKIKENFKRTFEILFGPESEADLKLVPDENGNIDPLESKIEIMAKPKGKRLQSIDLLSAGEKTLTAIALLFAIYLVKPSPFCVLDEVDAPLDDANIDKFINLLRSFSKDTQFIIVTHNKKTMEAADTLYGVTMEEEGVSKIVSVRFKQEVERA